MSGLPAESDENFDWNVFGAGTEAGRLLARLYGDTTSTSKGAVKGVTYPKIKARPPGNRGTENRAQWKPSHGGKLEDNKKVPSFDKSRALSVNIPKVGRAKKQTSDDAHGTEVLGFIPKKKDQKSCEDEIRKSATLNHAYRPPNQKEVSTDQEKQRLNEIFAYKGGCALPRELTHPAVDAPFELKLRAKEAKRQENMRRKKANTLDKGVQQKKMATNVLFDDIVSEIKERREFQTSMEALGRGEASRVKISQEIATRVKKLTAIDTQRAAEVASRLRSGTL
jgi:hypothetical protein